MLAIEPHFQEYGNPWFSVQRLLSGDGRRRKVYGRGSPSLIPHLTRRQQPPVDDLPCIPAATEPQQVWLLGFQIAAELEGIVAGWEPIGRWQIGAAPPIPRGHDERLGFGLLHRQVMA